MIYSILTRLKGGKKSWNVNFDFLKFEYQKVVVNSKSHTNKTFDFNSNLKFEKFDNCRNANFVA